MSTATLTMAETVQQAHAALHMAMDSPRRKELQPQIFALAAALDGYKRLDPAAMLWEAGLPLFRDETDPDTGRLLKAAEGVRTAAGALIAAMAAKGIPAVKA